MFSNIFFNKRKEVTGRIHITGIKNVLFIQADLPYILPNKHSGKFLEDTLKVREN